MSRLSVGAPHFHPTPVRGDTSDMKPGEVLLVAFENVAGHIHNLSYVRELVGDIAREADSLQSVRARLKQVVAGADITLRTDVRILLDEMEHVLRRLGVTCSTD